MVIINKETIHFKVFLLVCWEYHTCIQCILIIFTLCSSCNCFHFHSLILFSLTTSYPLKQKQESFLFLNGSKLCWPHMHKYGAIYQNMINLPGTTSLKKTDSPFPNGYRLSIALQMGIVAPLPLLPSLKALEIWLKVTTWQVIPVLKELYYRYNLFLLDVFKGQHHTCMLSSVNLDELMMNDELRQGHDIPPFT